MFCCLLLSILMLVSCGSHFESRWLQKLSSCNIMWFAFYTFHYSLSSTAQYILVDDTPTHIHTYYHLTYLCLLTAGNIKNCPVKILSRYRSSSELPGKTKSKHSISSITKSKYTDEKKKTFFLFFSFSLAAECPANVCVIRGYSSVLYFFDDVSFWWLFLKFS